jgi:hypothetical protein
MINAALLAASVALGFSSFVVLCIWWAAMEVTDTARSFERDGPHSLRLDR